MHGEISPYEVCFHRAGHDFRTKSTFWDTKRHNQPCMHDYGPNHGVLCITQLVGREHDDTWQGWLLHVENEAGNGHHYLTPVLPSCVGGGKGIVLVKGGSL